MILIGKINESSSSPQKYINEFIATTKSVSEEREKRILNAILILDIDHINALTYKSKGAELSTTLSSVMEPIKKIVLNITNFKLVNNKYIFGEYLGEQVIKQQAHVNLMLGKEIIYKL